MLETTLFDDGLSSAITNVNHAADVAGVLSLISVKEHNNGSANVGKKVRRENDAD